MAEVFAEAEIDIKASPETVWEVLTDLESFPSWSKIHKEVEVLTYNDEGWPERVRMKMSVVGISDEQVIEHAWTDDAVSWNLVSGSIQRAQSGRYSVTETDDGCHCVLQGSIDLIIPVPKIVLRQGQKMVMSIATKGVKARAEELERAKAVG